MTNVTIQGKFADTGDQKIKITKQISDVFDLGKVSASYTNSITLPNTPNNTEIMQGLGIDNNSSRVPYEITKATIDIGGFSIFNNGVLSVNNTKGGYNISIMDGNVNFMKLIENKTLGTDIDLSNFQHVKSLNTYIASLNNPYYRYLIADYNGKFGGDFIYLDWQVPSFNVQKLFEAMLSSLEWTYEMHPKLAEFFNDLWITYPTSPTYEETPEDTVATLYRQFYASSNYIVRDGLYVANEEGNWTTSEILKGQLVDNRYYKVEASGTLKIEVSVEAYVRYTRLFASPDYLPARLMIYRNGALLYWFETDPYNVVTDSVDLYASSGDVIEVFVAAFINPLYRLQTRVNSINVSVKEINLGAVSATEAFKDFTLTDFFKEILWRTGLIPLPSDEEKVLKFKSISERLDTTTAVNWSDEIAEIESESYVPPNMAQNNYFRMKYNDGDAELRNGNLKVENQNLPIEKTLGQSKMYAPSQTANKIPHENIFAVNAPLYNGDEKVEDGVTTYNYKSLNNRFYFLRRKRVVGETAVTSFYPLSTLFVNAYDYATVENTLLDQLVFENFSEYEKIFYAFKMQKIKLNLSLLDALQLRLDIPYYFRNSYWLLNSITFQDGELSTAEVIKINK